MTFSFGKATRLVAELPLCLQVTEAVEVCAAREHREPEAGFAVGRTESQI